MPYREQFNTLLQECLARIEAGESIDDCLRDHPEHADELADLLWLATQLRTLAAPKLSEATRQQARIRAHAALAALRNRPTQRPFWGFGMRLALGSLATFVFLLGSLGIGVAAAQTSLPGQALYGLKRQSEELRLQFALSNLQEAELRLQFASRRLDEALASINDCTDADERLRELAAANDAAWQTISQLEPTAQQQLRERFNNMMQSYQQFLANLPTSNACQDSQSETIVAELAPTSTSTPTPTSTATPSDTPTPTNMPRPVVIVRRTPTFTPTFTPTATPTEMPTSTPTTTPTETPKPKRSNNHRPAPIREPIPTVQPTSVPQPPTSTPLRLTATVTTEPTNEAYPLPATATSEATSTETPEALPTDEATSTPAVTLPTDVTTEPTATEIQPPSTIVETARPTATSDKPLERTPGPTSTATSSVPPVPSVRVEEKRTATPSGG